jgi:hypothetical protein
MKRPARFALVHAPYMAEGWVSIRQFLYPEDGATVETVLAVMPEEDLKALARALAKHLHVEVESGSASTG